MRHRPEASVTARESRRFKPWHRIPVLGFGTALAMGLLPLCADAQPVRERVSVGVVTISLTAQTSSGKPVRDLAPEDLSLRVDGQPVQIDSLTGSGRAASRREPAPAPGARESRPSAVTASEAAVASVAEPEQIAVLIDEGGSNSNDRRDVYRLLGRYLRDSMPAGQTIMVARSDGMKLDVLVPWTQKSGDIDAALGILASHPARPRIVSPHEITSLRGADLMGLKKEVLFARERLTDSILDDVEGIDPAFSEWLGQTRPLIHERLIDALQSSCPMRAKPLFRPPGRPQPRRSTGWIVKTSGPCVFLSRAM